MLVPSASRDGETLAVPPGSSAPGFTDDPAALGETPEQDAVDARVRALVRGMAERLALPRTRRPRVPRRGARGVLTSQRYRGGSDELDLDATIEVLAERPIPEEDDIVVRERVQAVRSVVLAVDLSGSTKGERLAVTIATVGALAGELQRDRLGVVAFWSDAAVLLRPGEPVRPDDLVETLLRIPAQGLTNVAFPLEIAAGLLAGAPTRDARVVLLSDCVHNAGPDPRPFAAALPRLDVLLDATGEKDIDLGRRLAAAGRGTCRIVRRHGDVVAAVSAIFAD